MLSPLTKYVFPTLSHVALRSINFWQRSPAMLINIGSNVGYCQTFPALPCPALPCRFPPHSHRSTCFRGGVAVLGLNFSDWYVSSSVAGDITQKGFEKKRSKLLAPYVPKQPPGQYSLGVDEWLIGSCHSIHCKAQIFKLKELARVSQDQDLSV